MDVLDNKKGRQENPDGPNHPVVEELTCFTKPYVLKPID